MATKTISISEEAYDILKRKKAEIESFSEAIVRLAGKKKLASFFGVLSKESADSLEMEIMESRKRHHILTRNKKHFEKVVGLQVEGY